MDSQQIADAAALLVGARRGGQRLADLPLRCRPATVAEAQAIQDAVAAQLGEAIGAYKAAAPPGDEPWRGLIYSRTVRTSPVRVPVAEVPDCGVEAEVAFRFRRDLPARADPYSRDEVAGAVDACAAIELITSRFQDQAARTTLEKLADCVSNGGFVYAGPIGDWQHLDLGQIRVSLSVNGEVQLDQRGGHPTGDPLGTAVALVNMLRSGSGVRAGQFVTCGSYTGMRFLKPGDACTVRFDGLGVVEATFATR
jgi:2-keto-4-pentenoate hydratase